MTPVLVGITVLLTAAWGATAVLRHQSAALRHAVWACALAAALLLGPLRWNAPQHVVAQALPVVLTPTVTVAAGRPEGSLNLVRIAFAVWVFGAVFVAFPLLNSWIELRRIVRGARCRKQLARSNSH